MSSLPPTKSPKTIEIGGETITLPSHSAEASDFDIVEETEWLNNVENHDGSVTDRRGQNEVSVMTGTEGNGGNFPFDPVLIRIDKVQKWK